ncbi:hypothetical protein [Burkholderia lata]|uniref:Uncharacterized protein n=1 Tax=Burkholderia lata (strain ATCC 17760 / DSM 23089 / LMG 22485 / NCIMB 9086 / R18194 / 383) TaxID=482957 RepID=A0A6P2GQC6_BURL3|nr:hypothetical protein [Burkholderia lata]VWB06671.1 hypothetical protein BLA15945_00122 [Burkholderia lata]VWB21854.1 hypothetical protein BLA15816_00875 [Burkholderia lata]
MGYGAFMSVTNNRSTAVKTFVTDVNCMYENGGDGSHLEYFDNLLIGANSHYPDSGRVYIEAKNSGSCFFESAKFRLKVTDNSNGAIIGTVSFSDSDANWNVASNTNPDVLNVNIDNSGHQATITVTVAAS